jgi:hypothetical protein
LNRTEDTKAGIEKDNPIPATKEGVKDLKFVPLVDLPSMAVVVHGGKWMDRPLRKEAVCRDM